MISLTCSIKVAFCRQIVEIPLIQYIHLGQKPFVCEGQFKVCQAKQQADMTYSSEKDCHSTSEDGDFTEQNIGHFPSL